MAREKTIRRYSDADLGIFRQVLEQKITDTREQLSQLEGQLYETNALSADDHGGDWVEDSNRGAELELLHQMAARQRKYLNDLLQAMQRIHNKSYGVCSISGELIDRRRLLAVPTTTKSLAAKSALHQQNAGRQSVRLTDQPYIRKGSNKPSKRRKIISRIVSKAEKDAITVRSERKESDAQFDEELLKGGTVDLDDLVVEDED